MIEHRRLVDVLVLIVLSLLPISSHAQGPPINTDTPIMLGLEGRGVRTFLKVVRMDKLLENGEKIPDPMDRSVTVFLFPVVVPFNLTATTQVGVIAPFLTKDLKSTAGDNSQTGFGSR